MEGLEEKLGYKFKNIDLLKNALTHSSYANEVRGGFSSSNERLEFWGFGAFYYSFGLYLQALPLPARGRAYKIKSLACVRKITLHIFKRA